MFWIGEALHLALSLLAGIIVYKIWGNKLVSFIAAIAAGFLIDADHLFDYLLAFGWKFSLMDFLMGRQFLVSDKLYLPLHGWEYVIVLMIIVIVFKNKIFRSVALALGLSLFLHLAADTFWNHGLMFKSYSIIYRARNDFETERLVTPEHWEQHIELKVESL